MMIKLGNSLMKRLLEAMDEFVDPSGWGRSKNGNFTRLYDDRNVTVFRKRGRWWWSIFDRDTDDLQYSENGFETAAEAKENLAELFFGT